MIWQTTDWGKMLLASKQAENIFTVSWIQVEKRSLWLWKFGLFVIGLDYTLPWIDGNIPKVEEFLIELCKKEKALFIQVEPINYSGELKNKYFDILHFDFGSYKKFINPYTAIIDLSLSEEEILAGMKQKGRYNIKLATKRGVSVQAVEPTKENIEAFYNLLQETTTRDNFNGNSLEYYITFLEYIKESKLILAYKDDQVIAGGIFTFRDELAIYYYWASTSQKEYRNCMAPYLVQWEAIKIAKSHGSKIYDFLWVAPEGIDAHPLLGVTNFKKKFTNDIRKVSESYIYIDNKFMYNILLLLRKVKIIIWKFKRPKKSR